MILLMPPTMIVIGASAACAIGAATAKAVHSAAASRVRRVGWDICGISSRWVKGLHAPHRTLQDGLSLERINLRPAFAGRADFLGLSLGRGDRHRCGRE